MILRDFSLQKKKTARNPKYLAWIRTHQCVDCEKRKADHAHHIISKGVALKCSDYFTLPVCVECHMNEENGRSEKLKDREFIWRKVAEYMEEWVLQGYKDV